MPNEMEQARELQKRICELADRIIDMMQNDPEADIWVAIGALATAMQSLARAGKIPQVKISEALTIARHQIYELDHQPKVGRA